MSLTCIGVLGAGMMGGGIARMFAEKGFPVRIWDIDADLTRKALDHIEARQRNSVEKGQLDSAIFAQMPDRLTAVEALEDLQSATLIVEAVIENFEAKKVLFERLEKIVSPETVVGTNTSSLRVEALAAGWRNPSRFLGIHFFNPPNRLRLVELVKTSRVSPAAVAKVKQVLQACGKTVVEVKDSPGFIVNRLLLPMINEAARLVDEGVAGIEEIDTAMSLGALHPAGPLKVADLIGLDVCGKILTQMAESLENPSFRPAEALLKRIADGRLGRKTSAGFYNYPSSQKTGES